MQHPPAVCFIQKEPFTHKWILHIGNKNDEIIYFSDNTVRLMNLADHYFEKELAWDSVVTEYGLEIWAEL